MSASQTTRRRSAHSSVVLLALVLAGCSQPPGGTPSGSLPSPAVASSPRPPATQAGSPSPAGSGDPARLGNSGSCTFGHPPQADPPDPATAPRVSLPPDAIATLATG